MNTGINGIRRILAILVVAAAFLVANNAMALIDLGITTGQPSGLANELVRLNQQIDAYNAANNPDLPAAVLAGAVDTQTPTGPTSIDVDITGWTYIKLKWNGNDQFYYVGDETGVLHFDSTIFNKGSGQPEGLSHYALFNPTSVPDAGSSLALLGIGLVSAEVFRRKFAKA